jgi:hypothetical protein
VEGGRFTTIFPIPVSSGQRLTVAVYLDGSGGTFTRLDEQLPRQAGSIRIDASTWAYTGGADNDVDGRPTAETTTRMYGGVDIGFTPSSVSALSTF